MGEIYLEWPDFPDKGKVLRMDIKSMQYGVGRGVTNGQGGKGKERKPEMPNVSEIVVTKDQDANTTNIFREYHGGQGRRMNVIFYDKDKKTKRLTIELGNALIANYSPSGGIGGPTESFSINFTSIKYKYDVGYVGDGVNRSGYDPGYLKGM